MPDINCDCTSDITYRTLAEMRSDMLIGLGRGNQLASPGPGVAALVNMHLRKAQERIYARCSWMMMERYFSWPLVTGTKFYGLHDNADECEKTLNPHKITSVSIVRDSVFYPLIAGIPATLETYTEIAGPPQRYEVRGCIEVWPTPTVDGDTLVVKGNFDLLPLVADADRASLDDGLICDLALATLKRHFRQPDANDYVQMAEVKLRNLIAGSHTTNRYIPGRRLGSDLVWVEPRPSVPFPS